jgi:hypothetical protein
MANKLFGRDMLTRDAKMEGNYPLGSWSGGNFSFKSPAAEEQWRRDAVDAGVHFQGWNKGRKLGEKAQPLAELGFAPSDDTYRGPDGSYYQITPPALEDPQITAMRNRVMKIDSTRANIGAAVQRANNQIAPQAMALMREQQASIAGSQAKSSQFDAANDNKSAANDNDDRAKEQYQLAQEVILTPPDEFLLPEGMTPLDELPEGSAGGEGAGMPFSKPKGEEPRPCIYCGKPTEKEQGPNQYHRDHIIPRSKGGNNSRANRGDACRSCNLKKGPRTPREWYKANGWIAQWLARINRMTASS